jgi:hypothetical protein
MNSTVSGEGNVEVFILSSTSFVDHPQLRRADMETPTAFTRNANQVANTTGRYDVFGQLMEGWSAHPECACVRRVRTY